MQLVKTLATATVLTLAGSIAQAETLWETGGFDMPESIFYDPDQNHLVVSVMVGAPNAADGNGRLALLTPEGSVIDSDWTVGMNAPKGMALMGGKLFVADLTRLHIVDAASGTLLQSLPAEGAVFLNDVTANANEVFVSDMMTNTIWRYSDGTFAKWLESTDLNHPNGLLWDNDRLLVGSWGKGLKEDFTTDVAGSLLAIDPETRSISVVAEEVGNIDGIVRANGQLILNDWINGALFEIEENGSVSKIAVHPAGLADIGAHGETLYLPHMLEGRIEAVRMSQ